MNMFVCQLLTDGAENQQHSQDIALLDLPQLEFIDVAQVRIDRIPHILCICAVLLSSWFIHIDLG